MGLARRVGDLGLGLDYPVAGPLAWVGPRGGGELGQCKMERAASPRRKRGGLVVKEKGKMDFSFYDFREFRGNSKEI